MRDDSNWLRVEGGEEELECPLSLESHLQELLCWEEILWLVQEWMMASCKLQYPTTPNPLPWKKLSAYCGMFGR